MNIKKIRACCAIFITLIMLFSLCITPIGAYKSDEYALQIGDINTLGEFSNIRFWERLNKMQAYVVPTSQYYYDGILAEMSPKLSYTPVSLPQYVTNPMTLPDIDEDDYSDLDKIMSLWSYTDGTEYQTPISSNISISKLSNGGSAYTGTMKYTITPTTTQTVDSSYRILWVGDTYSYDVTHNYDGVANDVDITGLRITNPADSGGSVVVYLLGTMQYLGSAEGLDKSPTGSLDLNTYVFLNPGYSVSIDDVLIEGQTGDVIPIQTRFSGSIMIRYGEGTSLPVEFEEQYNDYFSVCYSYSDYNLVGLEYGSDGRNGGSDIVNSWAINYYMNQSLEPDYGQKEITSNGVYSTKNYTSVKVDVPQEIAWSGLWDWLFDSAGAFMAFEIAPDWSIGVILSIIVGLAVAIWAIRVFMGG